MDSVAFLSRQPGMNARPSVLLTIHHNSSSPQGSVFSLHTWTDQREIRRCWPLSVVPVFGTGPSWERADSQLGVWALQDDGLHSHSGEIHEDVPSDFWNFSVAFAVVCISRILEVS